MVAYSTAFKAKMVRRLASPGGPSANALSQEVGIGQTTLSRWLREAGTDRITAMNKPMKKRPRDWSAEEKMAAVVEASSVSEEQLGAFLRRKGLHQAQLDEWRGAMLSALGGEQKRKAKSSPQARQLRELEKELRRKDKALAEAAALLILKKKPRKSGGTRPTTPGRGEADDPQADRRGGGRRSAASAGLRGAGPERPHDRAVEGAGWRR